MKYEDFEINDGHYELKNGVTVRVWTQSDGQWACAANDHGPFCRRDHPISEEVIEAVCLSQALDGALELRDDPDKGWTFRVTPSGKKEVEAIMARAGMTLADLEAMDEGQLRDFLK